MIGIFCEQTATKFSVTWAGQGQAFFAASVRSPADATQTAWDAYTRIAETLREHQLEIIHERIFGSLSVERDVMSAREQGFASLGISPVNPVTYVEGVSPWGEGLASVIIHAVSADAVWKIMDGKEPCGRGWRRNASTYLMLQNIQGQTGSKSGQVRRMFFIWLTI